jgi:DNA (cytosine-5)-methyltransferase 1
MITVATDCSGIEAPLQALIQLKIPYKQLWSCEIDHFARESAAANYPKPAEVYNDIITRDHSVLPHVDLYVCGFPCQSFSSAGKRLGTADPRASVINAMLSTIENSRPKILILENVTGFKSIENGKPYSELIKILEKNYFIDASVYNTKDFGLPQNRKRIYFVGIRRDLQKKVFVKPKEVKMKPLASIIDSTNISNTPMSSIYHKNLKNLKNDTKIITPYNYYSAMGDISPTLVTGCGYFFLLRENRPFTIKELLSLQGFPKNFKVVVSKTQIVKQIGNSMSVCVVKLIIKEALKCI